MTRRLSVPVLTIILWFQAASAEAQTVRASEPWRDWANVVAQSEPGDKIRLRLMQAPGSMRGRLIARDNAAITVELNGGGRQTFDRPRVRRLETEMESMRRAPAVGAAAGAAVAGGLIARVHDIVPTGKLLFAAAGAGIGALGGWGIGRLGRYKLIYEAPKK